MSSRRNINALVDVFKSRVEIVGAELPDSERAIVQELATAGLELLRQFLLDVNRCADALETLATDRRTARSGKQWP
jgi:hypothetical protein